jgi:hypothetical protein
MYQEIKSGLNLEENGRAAERRRACAESLGRTGAVCEGCAAQLEPIRAGAACFSAASGDHAVAVTAIGTSADCRSSVKGDDAWGLGPSGMASRRLVQPESVER